MPTINLAAGSSTQLEPRPAHQHHLRLFAVHAYLGIAVTLIIVTIWCFTLRQISSTSSLANFGSQPEVKEIKASSGRVKLSRKELAEGSHPKRFSQNLVHATPSSMNKLSHPFSSTYTRVPHPSRHPQTMDGDQNKQRSHRSDPEATASRGTSQKPLSSSSSSSSFTLDQLQGHMPPSKTFTSTDGTTSPGLTSREEDRGTKRLQTQIRQIDRFGISTAQGENAPAEATAIPRRGSYTKSAPVGIPIPSSSSSLSSGTTVTSSSFLPSSHMPAPPPPVSQDYQFVGGHMGHRVLVSNQHQDEIEVRGETISVINDDGHGWQRHTQVYGGGVCLACLGNEGGFYGPHVPLEDRRY
ncbi:hypothetical protein QR685DRAFT_65129 [Neurospora intermedia]|uniref:Uncharacterized protein n=1 Tax=Neurospora intermedia TaxID=5142 RepID=A0ABR3DTG3_NEUIN